MSPCLKVSFAENNNGRLFLLALSLLLFMTYSCQLKATVFYINDLNSLVSSGLGVKHPAGGATLLPAPSLNVPFFQNGQQFPAQTPGDVFVINLPPAVYQQGMVGSWPQQPVNPQYISPPPPGYVQHPYSSATPVQPQQISPPPPAPVQQQGVSAMVVTPVQIVPLGPGKSVITPAGQPMLTQALGLASSAQSGNSKAGPAGTKEEDRPVAPRKVLPSPSPTTVTVTRTVSEWTQTARRKQPGKTVSSDPLVKPTPKLVERGGEVINLQLQKRKGFKSHPLQNRIVNI